MQSTDSNSEVSKRSFFGLLFLAFALFLPLFITGGFQAFDFWAWMTFNVALLCICSIYIDRGYLERCREDLSSRLLRKMLLGVFSAALLYALFFVGNWFLHSFLPSLASQAGAVYDYRDGASRLRIALLLLFIIGPGEEFFWRGFVQHHLQCFYGTGKGLLWALLCYTATHIGSANAALVMAALVCGLLWGLMYIWKKSVFLNALSHVLWDLAVFLIFPFV